jgi:hypothetical protein
MSVNYVRDKLREINEVGAGGIFLSPMLQLFDPANTPGFDLVMEYSERNDLIVAIHMGLRPEVLGEFSSKIMPRSLGSILEKYNVDLVITGAEVSPEYLPTWVNDALRLMNKYDNVYLVTTDINCYLFKLGKVRSIGIERFIFGSRFPCRGITNLNREMLCIEGRLTRTEKEGVLVENARELLKNHGM